MTTFLIVAEKAVPKKKGGRPFGGTAKPFGTKPQGGADAMPEIPEDEDELITDEVVPDEGEVDDPIDEPLDDEEVVEDEVVEEVDPLADPAAVEDEVDPLADEGMLDGEVAAHEWSGDLIDTGVEEVTTPEAAFSAFTGTEGETAWLDRADDGTLTGWVMDADGSTYRYSDVDAWAVDVDDAQMVRTDGQVEDEVEEVDDATLAAEDGSASTDPGVDDFLEGKQVVLRAVVRPHS